MLEGGVRGKGIHSLNLLEEKEEEERERKRKRGVLVHFEAKKRILLLCEAS